MTSRPDPILDGVRQRLDAVATELSHLDHLLSGEQPPPGMLVCRLGVAADRAACELASLASAIEAAKKGGAA